MSDVIALDTETFYSSKLKYSLTTMVAEQYARHQLFDLYMVSVSDGKNTWAGHPNDFEWGCLFGKTVVMHNKYHDWAMLTEMERRGLIPPGTLAGIKACYCTASMTAYLCNRRALADAVEHLLGVKVDKSARSDANGKHWPKDFSPEEQAKMIEYARGDAHLTWRLWNEFSSQWPEDERILANLTIDAGLRGVQIDVPLLNTFIMQTHDMKMATQALLPWLDDEWDEEDEFNQKPTSTKCIAEQCRRIGIPAPPVKSHDEDAYEEWEATYAPNHAWIRALSSWRSINKLLKTFETMKARLRDDGTMPFGQKYCGTHTGRVAGESRVNLFNQRKQAVLCRQDGLMETDDVKIDDAHKAKKKTGAWPEWVKHAIDFRNLIIPRPGCKMITSDLSQVEPRVSAWLAGDTEFLKLVAEGFSPYQAHAMTTMGWTGGNLKEEDPKKYDLAKARLLALGFGAGWEKLIVMAKRLGIDLTTEDPEWIEIPDLVNKTTKKVSGYGLTSKKVVKDYRESNQRVVAVWRSLDDAFKQSISNNLTLTLPSGRKLVYEKVRCETRIEPDPETKLPRRKSVFTCSIGGRRTITYGSKLFENIVQATAREVFMSHVLALHRAGMPMLIGVYDEAVLEIPLDNPATPDDVKAIMSQTPSWLAGCPLSADAKQVERYTK